MKALDNYQLKLVKGYFYSFSGADYECAWCTQEVYINIRTIVRMERASDHFEYVDVSPETDKDVYSSKDWFIAYTEDDNWYLVEPDDAKHLIEFGDILKG